MTSGKKAKKGEGRAEGSANLGQDLMTMIDNLGQSDAQSPPHGSRGSSDSPMLQLPLKQIAYRHGNPVRATRSEDPGALDCGCRRRLDCPRHSNEEDDSTSTQCYCCCCHHDESDDTTSGVPPIRPDSPPPTDDTNTTTTVQRGDRRQTEGRVQSYNAFKYESINRYHRNHIGVHRGQPERRESALVKLGNMFRRQSRPSETGGVRKMLATASSWYNNIGKKNGCRCCDSRKPSSGQMLPNFYTANVKNTERFTFNAVTGIPDCLPCGNISNNAFKGDKIEVERRSITEPPIESLPTLLPKKVTKGSVVPVPIEDLNADACGLKQGYTSFHPPPERIDIYCFDHQNAGYFQTTDNPPPIHTEFMIEKMETFSSNFWAEIFAFVHIFINFIMAFILQFFKFLLFTIVRPLMVGILQLASDYFWKPFLTILFNGIIQPIIIFLYNIATSLRDLALPLAQGLGYYLREFAIVVRAFRLIDVKNSTTNGPFELPK